MQIFLSFSQQIYRIGLKRSTRLLFILFMFGIFFPFEVAVFVFSSVDKFNSFKGSVKE